MSVQASSETETYLPSGLPAPAWNPQSMDAEFWNGAKAHQLMVQTCAACAMAQWPPEEICSACHSFDRTWVQAAGTGKIFAWTRVWHPVHPALTAAGPYVVLVVELDDYAVRIVGNLLGDPLQDVVTGTPVRVAFEDLPGKDATIVQWSRA